MRLLELDAVFVWTAFGPSHSWSRSMMYWLDKYSIKKESYFAEGAGAEAVAEAAAEAILKTDAEAATILNRILLLSFLLKPLLELLPKLILLKPVLLKRMLLEPLLLELILSKAKLLELLCCCRSLSLDWLQIAAEISTITSVQSHISLCLSVSCVGIREKHTSTPNKTIDTWHMLISIEQCTDIRIICRNSWSFQYYLRLRLDFQWSLRQLSVGTVYLLATCWLNRKIKRYLFIKRNTEHLPPNKDLSAVGLIKAPLACHEH